MRLTIRDFQKMKTDGVPIVMLTAYDAMTARAAEAAGVPLLLVGDSLGMVVQGHDSTVPVTLDHMIYHSEIVSRVTQKPFIVTDLPFMTYHISEENALLSAAKVMQQGNASAVKVEGGAFLAPTIKRIVQAGIPVMGHLGLTPQSVHQFGGFRVQGRELDSARKLLQDALAVQEAGAFALVLELVPAPLAQFITERLTIPTIGIGAGAGCSGQVQVIYDLLALAGDFVPKHAKQYATLGEKIESALRQYLEEVQAGTFPTEAQSFTLNPDILQTLREEFA